MKRRHKKIASLILTLLIISIGALGQQNGWFGQTTQTLGEHDPGRYAISRFVDGDTIVVNMNGKDETIRMIGVDTPETHHPSKPVQCYGPAAAAYTQNLIGDQKVRLEADPTNQNRDRYNRLLRYVYLSDGRMVEEELIRNGYGFAYTSFPFTKKEAFVQLEEQAKSANKGLWGNCTVTIDGDYKQTNAAE